MPIRADQLREKEDFQKLILERLEEDNKFRIRPNTAYKPGLAMDTEVLLEFLEDTQHDEMERLRRMYKDRTNDTVINYINSEINKESRGLIDVVKHGVEFDNGVTLRLMYRKPDSTINTQAVANYQKNIFSVMEEVYHKADERIDLVIFLNGLAVFTVELKCNTSGQSYEDAIKQYKNERDPSTRLFKSRVGVFAAFAMDLNEVYFTTELKGPDTFFNPFNIGENFGKGNPHNQNGVNISYMWENIWTKDKILFLIERFIYIKKKERRDADTGKIKKSKSLIFPRFHQLRAVERVMNDVIENHTSCNYLTIQLFGTLNAEGKKESFDLYSMKQAIEEGYILNVLDNYVTWKTYCHINKAIQDDPELQSITAKRKMARFIDLHDTNIAQKVEIIIEHFRANVAGCLDGKAKAMVITSSRLAAVKYRQEFERYIQARGYTGIQALVAFSGKVKLDDKEYTEAGMNGFKEEDLRYEFDRSCYQVLIVADKYQTGFDQPRLVAMYVDKRLRGVQAVQTLSRLNRICPPYDKTTFVLDFKNSYEDIKAAFEQYYKDTILFETISPSDIRDLDREIDAYDFLDADDIDEFNTSQQLISVFCKNNMR